jgi:hypothetical protein
VIRGLLGLAIGVVCSCLVAAAAEGPEPPPARVQMDEVEIRGEVERPDVFYIIPRREVPLDLGPRSKNYREEIMAPLLPGPFEEWVRTTRARVVR